ncbi:bifunctional phosphopantothenoylcysteine decarboxylase/phosphopantothenate--cysteine ligase CoaBC [Zymobacter sp. IVIA_12111.31 C1]|uniref:bifunctional phosphopantothenoylcysteine decarboxylase/phosphopantothenate--cysteine ligase CoaBC n=1 Tax=Zymobacter sp. IVIA_12111.31 C1 TaxID=3394854 RepID=UPI0039C42D8C
MSSNDSLSPLHGRRVLLGISGGIAAYKSAYLARLLKKAGADVRVVMTRGAEAFIAPLTFQALTGHAVRDSLLDPSAEAGMGHIELARWADVIVIAPATANLMASLAHGHADDLLTTLCLASHARLFIAPAMNQGMWSHPATQANLERLQQYGWHIVGPDAGEQACGDVGQGRMLEPEAILEALHQAYQRDTTPKPASGLRITVTAGPTREPLDPVRYLTNRSSGKMGFALAEAAQALGASVTLISGPVTLDTPHGVRRVDVTTADDMLAAAQQSVKEGCDLFISSAAVADYKAASYAEHKLKKQKGEETLTLTLVKNPDIVATIAAGERRPTVVGFAAETQDVEHYALDKLTRKKLDMIVANQVGANEGFDSDDNAVTLYWQTEGGVQAHELPLQSKVSLAHALLHEILRVNAASLASAAQDTP